MTVDKGKGGASRRNRFASRAEAGRAVYTLETAFMKFGERKPGERSRSGEYLPG
jgi:hypothetical protein